jgi:hypothetical protein
LGRCSDTQNLNDSIQGLTIGLPKEFFAEGLDNGVAKAIMAAVISTNHNAAFDFLAEAFGARTEIEVF